MVEVDINARNSLTELWEHWAVLTQKFALLKQAASNLPATEVADIDEARFELESLGRTVRVELIGVLTARRVFVAQVVCSLADNYTERDTVPFLVFDIHPHGQTDLVIPGGRIMVLGALPELGAAETIIAHVLYAAMEVLPPQLVRAREGARRQ